VALIPLDDDPRAPQAAWERWLGIAVATICCLLIAHRVHLIGGDWLVLRNTTPNGGDMGAHVYWPKFLIDEWFPKLRLQGWSPHWYSGFPIGQFYFPLPVLMMWVLDVVLPYNVAFKLVAVSGPIALPAAAYVFGAKLRFPWPTAPLFAIVAVRYTFELRYGLNNQPTGTGWTIYGGNLTSTMAGEFSFTIALALALLFLAALSVFLESGKRAWLPAVLLAGCVMSHIVVAAFAALLGVLLAFVHWWRFWRPGGRGPRGGFLHALRLCAPVAIVGALLTATWSLPLVGAQHFTASMRYEKFLNWGSALFGLDSVQDENGMWVSRGSIPRPYWLWLLVAIAIVAAGWWRRSTTLILAIAATIFGVLVKFWPEHHIWNTRFLPFFWLLLGFLAAIGAAELCRLAGYTVVGASEWVREGDRLDYLSALAAQRAGLEPDVGAGLEPDVGAGLEPDVGAGLEPDVGAGLEPEMRGADPIVPPLWDAPPDPLPAPPAPRAQLAPPDDDALAAYLPERLRTDSARATRRRAIVMGLTVALIAGAMGVWSLAWSVDEGEYGAGWARWNFEGYEVKRPGPPPNGTDGKGWVEYKRLMDTMGELPAGRALWETGNSTGSAGNDVFDNYGGALALELLPYWTDGKIGSMEGLYFESSATMPYHFLTVSEVAARPSNPVRGLNYGHYSGDFERGVRHMRMLGVRYYMAFNAELKAKADASSQLHLVATIDDIDGREPTEWKIYEVNDWSLVAPLELEPVIAAVHGGDKAECFGVTPAQPPYRDPVLDDWECAAAPWWMNDALLDQTFAESGPKEWRTVDISELSGVEQVPLPEVEISDVREAVDSISFRVDQIGVPVVVKTSYFPNWEVSGAEGPWRLSPNLMVVVPTDREVKLSFGLTSWDWAGRAGTLAGFVGLFWLWWWRPTRRPWWRAPTALP